jgi:hypothetical protein
VSTTKSYEEIIDFIAAGTTPEAVVAFHPSDTAQQRVAELIERSKDGSISAISAEDQSGVQGPEPKVFYSCTLEPGLTWSKGP